MEGRRVLAGVEVDETEVVRNDPFEGAKVEGLLEAGNGRDVTLWAGKSERLASKPRT